MVLKRLLSAQTSQAKPSQAKSVSPEAHKQQPFRGHDIQNAPLSYFFLFCYPLPPYLNFEAKVFRIKASCARMHRV